MCSTSQVVKCRELKLKVARRSESNDFQKHAPFHYRYTNIELMLHGQMLHFENNCNFARFEIERFIFIENVTVRASI